MTGKTNSSPGILKTPMHTLKRRFRRPFLAVFLGGVAILLANSPVQAAKVCESAPGFELRNLDGEMDSLEAHLKLPGKDLILVSFFQKLCAGCRDETRDILGWLAEGGTGKRAEFIMVAVQESRQKALEFLEDNGFKAYVLADPYGRLTKPYELSLLPKLVAINSKGKLVRIFEPGELRKIRESGRFIPTLNELLASASKTCR